MAFSIKSTEVIGDLERLLIIINTMEEHTKEFDRATQMLASSLQDKVADMAISMSTTILESMMKVKEYTQDLSTKVKANVERLKRTEQKAERD